MRTGRSGSGAVTYDRGVGFSHTDAQITHHIAPDIDAERDLLTADLEGAKVVVSTYEVSGIGPTLNGRNGGGDSYYTDGEIKFSVLVEGCGRTGDGHNGTRQPAAGRCEKSRMVGGRKLSAVLDRQRLAVTAT